MKRFRGATAVDGIDLLVRQGGVHGLLGPHGAGTTTTIRVLATLLRLDDGTARVFGHDVVTEVDAMRSRVSLTGQSVAVFGPLSMRGHASRADPAPPTLPRDHEGPPDVVPGGPS